MSKTPLFDLSQIHPSLRDSFVPLPSDPAVPLTPEQLKAVFPHPEVWREVIALVLKEVKNSDSSASSSDAA